MNEPSASVGTTGAPRPSDRRTRPTILMAMVLAVIFSLPSLQIGFFLDDYHQVALIEGLYDIERPSLNLYQSFLEFPDVPWWTSEEARTGFWRPLSSALLFLDHALFGRDPLPWHLHSLLWLAALIGIVGLLFRRLPANVGILALLLYALDESHSMTAGVICNRHALVTATVALVGLWAYLRYREDGWDPGRWLAPSIFALALGFGETTVAVMAYPLAYELCCRRDPWSNRIRAIAPLALLAMAYVVAYGYFELGPRGIDFYLNPLEDPSGFVIGLGKHLPALLSGGLVAFPASLWLVGPAMQTALEVVGSVALAILLFWSWKQRHRFFGPNKLPEPASSPDTATDLLPMWLIGALGALVAVAPSTPSDRQLLVPAIGFSVLVATWILESRELFRKAERSTIRVALGSAIALLLFLHAGLAPMSRLQMQWGTATLSRKTADIAIQLEKIAMQAGEPAPISRFLVIHSPDFFTTIYPQLIWEQRNGPGTISWNVITTTSVHQELVRTGDRTLETRARDGRFLRAPMDRAFKLGSSVTVEGGVIEPPGSTLPWRVEVLETAPPGNDPLDDGLSSLPTRLRFTVDGSLDVDWHLVTWRDGELIELEMPAVGQSILVEPSQGLMGLV